MKVYTKKGDTGTTQLIGGTRVLKSSIRIEAYGTIDELNSYIGIIRDQEIDEKYKKQLIEIQKTHGITTNIEEVCALLHFNNYIDSAEQYMDTIEPLVCLGKDDLEMMGKQIILNEYTTNRLKKDIYFIHE
jgi:ATP:cob(I)alamin adenosyltransferase